MRIRRKHRMIELPDMEVAAMQPQDGTAFGTPDPLTTAEQLDPAAIGRMVERQVSATFELARISADGITARAVDSARRVEAMIAELQQGLGRLGDQVRAIIDQVEPARIPPAPAVAPTPSLFEPSPPIVDLTTTTDRPVGDPASSPWIGTGAPVETGSGAGAPLF